MRIVSLVPSLTETIAYFGALDQLVARTRYCIEPAGRIDAVEAVGGTKNPDVIRIIEIRPDLVVVNREENRREDHDALVAAGIAVFVTHPRTVAEAAAMLADLGVAIGRREEGSALAERCRRALAAADAVKRDTPRVSTFCPIWRNPWMTFGESTFVGDMLRVAGMRNVFADEGDFFTVDLDDVVCRRPELVLLPDEPYVFSETHVRELKGHGLEAGYELVDGKDLSWYGPRMPAAVAALIDLTARTRAVS